jgi:hypothetical protein
MLPEYLVIERTDCLKCNGRGKIQNPAWARTVHALQGWAGSLATQNESPNLDALKGEPWELECPDCKGKGHLLRHVSLAHALDALRHG